MREPRYQVLAWSVFAVLMHGGDCLAADRAPAEMVQKQGPATLRLQAAQVVEGQIQIRLSDEVRVSLSVEDLPALEVETIRNLSPSKDWRVRQSPPVKTVLADGRTRWEQRFAATPMKPGDLSLPFVPLRFREGEVWQEATWKPVPVLVTTEIVQADLSELRDVTPPEPMPPLPSWWGAVSGVALVLAAAIGGMLFWRWCRRSWREVPVAPSVLALRALDRIPAPPADEVEAAAMFGEVSDVIRVYLAQRFQLPAPEQTTAEFVQTMRAAAVLAEAHQTLLQATLNRCDLVKFAGLAPSPEECAGVIAAARRFVVETSQIVPQPTEA